MSSYGYSRDLGIAPGRETTVADLRRQLALVQRETNDKIHRLEETITALTARVADLEGGS